MKRSNIWYLAREGFSFDGFDGSATAVKIAAERLNLEIPDWRERGSFQVGDLANLPYRDNTFDAVIDVEAICCNGWDESRVIICEIARVLKPQGKLFSQTFSLESFGARSGKLAGRNAWISEAGGFANKGLTRFTAFEEIPDLYQEFNIAELEVTTRTSNGRKDEIKEWIIVGEKHG